jgi:acyl dehydratase
MPLTSSLVGTSGEPLASEIDARWTMAYAAALGDSLPCYLDTASPRGIAAHPLFPVCFEWPVVVAMRGTFDRSGLTPDEARRGVHASHDLIIHRQIRPPARVQTRATVVGIERRKPGAYQLMRLDTVDATGSPICTSWYGSIYRDVAVAGVDRMAEVASALPVPRETNRQPRSEIPVPIAAGQAHIYTECARIFNPIHTDAAVAHQAGLPAIILHGTATLALAVSKIVAAQTNGDPLRIRRIAGRFGAMVMMPSQVMVRICAREAAHDGDRIFFEVLNDQNRPAIRDGLIVLAPPNGDQR